MHAQMAHAPAVLEAYVSIRRATGQHGTLDQPVRTALMLASAVADDSRYALAIISMLALRSGWRRNQVDALLAGQDLGEEKTDTLIGVALPQVAFQLSLSVLILRSFFRGVPSELEDASYIDGCGPIGFLWRILLPLSVPALAIVSVLAMEWERLIPGHPGAPNGRLGTKKDAQDQLTFLQDASAAMKPIAREGKCWDQAEKEFKLPKYEKWAGYDSNLPFVARRYCGVWGRGT